MRAEELRRLLEQQALQIRAGEPEDTTAEAIARLLDAGLDERCDEADLRNLRELAAYNAERLDAMRRGIASARRTIAELSEGPEVSTYSSDGEQSLLRGHNRLVERRL